MSTGDFPRVGFGGGELKAGNSNGLELSLLDVLHLDSEGTLKNGNTQQAAGGTAAQEVSRSRWRGGDVITHTRFVFSNLGKLTDFHVSVWHLGDDFATATPL